MLFLDTVISIQNIIVDIMLLCRSENGSGDVTRDFE